MGAVAETIRSKLVSAFTPARLEVIDESNKHAGHSGARAGGESHFTVVIEAAAFAGVARVQRQRKIYGVLAEELAGPVHALSVKALAPGEG
jgi:BolA protein